MFDIPHQERFRGSKVWRKWRSGFTGLTSFEQRPTILWERSVPTCKPHNSKPHRINPYAREIMRKELATHYKTLREKVGRTNIPVA
jgi:hypothetical protein